MLSCFKNTEKARFFKKDSSEVVNLRNLMLSTLNSFKEPSDDWTDYAYKYYFLKNILERYNRLTTADLPEKEYNYFKWKTDMAVQALKGETDKMIPRR